MEVLNFLSDLQKIEQRAKKCIVFGRECVEEIPRLVAVDCFLPGRAKDLSAPQVKLSPIALTARTEACACGHPLAGIAGSIPAADMFVCLL